jgi:hypothetical protein
MMHPLLVTVPQRIYKMSFFRDDPLCLTVLSQQFVMLLLTFFPNQSRHISYLTSQCAVVNNVNNIAAIRDASIGHSSSTYLHTAVFSR